MIIRRRPGVVWRKETRGGTADGLLLLNYTTRAIHFLEGLSALIWEECDGRTLEELVRAVGAEGHKEEVREFLESLRERGLVEIE